MTQFTLDERTMCIQFCSECCRNTKTIYLEIIVINNKNNNITQLHQKNETVVIKFHTEHQSI